MKTWQWLLPFCVWYWYSGSLYHSTTSWTRMTWASAGSNKYCHGLTFFCSLLAKSEATWVHPEELNFKAIYIYIFTHKNICCKNIDTIPMQSLQMEISAHFLSSLCLWKFGWGPLIAHFPSQVLWSHCILFKVTLSWTLLCNLQWY